MSATSIQNIAAFLTQHAPFDQMAAEELVFLAGRLKQKNYAKGEVVFGPDDGVAEHLYIVKEGLVRGVAGGKGKEGDAAWELMPGECFPVGALISRRPVRISNQAVEKTCCYALAREDFEALFKDSTVFHDFCTRRMANLLEDALRNVQAGSVSRVADGGSLNAACRSLVRRSPLSCLPDTSLHEALGTMARERIGSMIVIDDSDRPLGILNLYDTLSRVTLPALPLTVAIGEVMNRDVLTIGPDQPAYEAAMLMTRHGRDHMCVVNGRGSLIGVLSERDLFSLQRIGLVSLSRTIGRAEKVTELAALSRDVPRLVEQMIAQGASVDQLNKIITELNDAITQRVIELNLADFGDLPVPFVWLSFGSEGRIEQTLKTDQDNGILFVGAKGEKEQHRKRLLELGKRINQDLDSCGFPLCPGNIMASNPECCLTLKEWKKRFSKWIDQGTPAHLLYATIFFDFRALYGAAELADELREWLSKKVAENSRFRQQMAVNALRNRPPLGIFSDFRLTGGKDEHPHTLDLKLRGVTPFVDGARLIALAYGVEETNTMERLRGAADKGKVRRGDVDAWIEAYQFIQLMRMRNHQRQAERDKPLDNHLNPDDLNELDRRILKEAFRQARKLQSKLQLDYQL